MRISVVVVLLALFHSSSSLDIVMYNPAFGHSHMRYMGAIADVLIDAGHKVTEIRPIMDRTLHMKKISKTERIIEIDVDPRVATMMTESKRPGGMFEKMWEMDPSPMALAKLSDNMTRMMSHECEHVLFDSTLIDDLRKEKFDLGITEAFDFCGNGIFEAIGLKAVISTSSSILMDHQAKLLGVPLAPSYVPGGISGTFENMSLLERAGNGVGTMIGSSLFLSICDSQTALFRKKFGADFPDLRELVASSALLFTNSNPFLDFPHPTIHKVVDLGGVAIKQSALLNEEWDSILNRKPHTVLISFGSVAKSSDMSQAAKESVLRTVRSLPDVQFIWKYEKDDLTNVPENLMLSKWTPQGELLADKRLSLFVTHGGLASTTEIAFSGTPSIVIPIFADQPRNAKMLQRQGVAETFSKFDLPDSEKLRDVIGRMLRDRSYAERAEKLADLLANVPFKPKEVLLRNVEFVGRFGALPQLEPYGRHLSFAAYFLLDVVAVVVLALSAVLLLAFFVVRRIFSFCAVRIGKAKSD